MWAILGEIEFEVLASPSGFEQRFASEFAEHARVSGKPLLEALGGDLDEIALTILLHTRLGDVQARLREIRQAMTQQAPLALVLGDGSYLGPWVLTEGSVTTRKTDARGRIISAELQVSLREYAGEFSAPEPTQGTAGIAGTDSALAAQPGLLTHIEPSLTAAQAVARAARAAENLARGIDQAVQRALDLVPAAAIAQVHAMGGLIAQAAQSVNVLHDVQGFGQDIVQLGQDVTVSLDHLRAHLADPKPTDILSKLADARLVARDAVSRFEQSRAALVALTSDVAMRKV